MDRIESLSDLPGLDRLGGRKVTAETERIRERVQLLISITSRSGGYRDGLEKAAGQLTDQEAQIISSLEGHGLDVVRLREVLCGAHVLVDDPELYEQWRFPESRERLSSHHKHVDKEKWPDLGLKGPLVREKLHGRTSNGTWIQLEKTPATMGKGLRLPDWSDVMHLWDYVVYRITKRNVGPWGLSGATEARPMYLSPDLQARVPLPDETEGELTATISRIEEDDDVTSASPDLAALFPPPDRANDLLELVFTPEQLGTGLFGGSDVWITRAPSRVAGEVLATRKLEPSWNLPPAGETTTRRFQAGDLRIPITTRLEGRSEEQQ